ncbi:flagellar basal-body MS-ring/collar protein FliF [Erythrobacter sp. EC-HK427]|uniref:flagellar basal-body MS-ring/collar protein FliF n=1 Tax=Erythrobacter sp. EC-HK427 TaxID=2038396 RepID=UPI00125BF0B5|nr:flagellar basal-body MS-ring/collar protein FliF [Erythrobacter sp. EC-HK427]VVT01661.1 Flagellar M-ring protein [Erythrobacter sp. EC-HK427]
MADAVPSAPLANPQAISAPLAPQWSAMGPRVGALLAQPGIRKALPAIVAGSVLGAVGLGYLAFAEGPQRVLYTSLSDAERAEVVGALETAAITYSIDPATGALSVAEDDLYRARMLVASDTALASPDNSIEILDSMPLGTSRTLEGERLRTVRERELVRTIEEINGVESARVHLAAPERSVFVRENNPPSASVMLRLTRGRSLSPDQVQAIVNLVSGSVPGLSPADVRVVDQQGQLLSDTSSDVGDALDLQREHEEKLRIQIAQVLTPLIGEGNFSSEVQVDVDMSEVTRAEESYDREGAVRSISESEATQRDAAAAGGVPGALSNTPPPPTGLEEGPPDGEAAPAGEAGATTGQSSSQRIYELGREVAVTSSLPGTVRRLSVGIAISSEALEAIEPATADDVQQLVAASVGANLERGDVVTVITGGFDPVEEIAVPFYEAPWFAMALRYGAGALVLLLALLFIVRPITRALPAPAQRQEDAPGDEDESLTDAETGEPVAGATTLPSATLDGASEDDVQEQVRLARQFAVEQPERAVTALRRMLAAPGGERA